MKEVMLNAWYMMLTAGMSTITALLIMFTVSAIHDMYTRKKASKMAAGAMKNIIDAAIKNSNREGDN